MSENLSLVVDIVKIFAGAYGLIAVGIIIYGVISILKRETRVFKDEDSSYGFSKKITVIDSVISRSFKPFFYHRTIPHNSEGLYGEPATIMGWIYIIIGLFMLSPLVWAYIKFK